jgi:hypothetical protein
MNLGVTRVAPEKAIHHRPVTGLYVVFLILV